MTKVFLHHKEDGQWVNEERNFARLPCVGEYVALDTSSLYYRVYLVVHCPFETEYEAEVYLMTGVSQADVVVPERPLPMPA
jgi:hypothetical protein